MSHGARCTYHNEDSGSSGYDGDSDDNGPTNYQKLTVAPGKNARAPGGRLGKNVGIPPPWHTGAPHSASSGRPRAGSESSDGDA
ncbi:uncharacterized protein GLRG_01872 [Colletotrichum graminicola M1.001]|uniref:Uncharacterized protein n=1 Tax=Colletotrichum graminicola (strain M1.001 / M2 / FGSC 10212) TaxID=645133 RepID=E3Q9J8_COLGM|nr:uncharacterized protein GLRG_01872 [Colletotrichum graminicola M1.001]EFQ27377.1 hypothetical protein GLRG_01872 [Colletotrichum graminicola M1.001]